MGKLLLIVLVVSGCMLFSCTPTHKEKDVSIHLLDTTQDSLYYSMFVDSISYIALEDKDECLIGRVSDVIITNEHLFVLDGKQQIVWGFDRDGKYQFNINKRGNGPGEYMRLVQFEYDKERNELLLLDGWSKSILHYTVDGKFVKSEALDIYCSDFKIVDDGYILSMLGGSDSLGGVFHYVSDEGKSRKLIGRSYDLPCNYDWEMVNYDGNIGLMAPPLDNILYACDSLGQLVERISFRMHPLPSDKYETNETMEHLSDFVRTNYMESSHWIYATYWCAEYGLRVFLYDKVNGASYVGQKLLNDMDGIPFTSMTSFGNNNLFIFATLKNGIDCNPVLQILHLK